MHQVTMVCLNELVSSDHMYRKFKKIWDFRGVERLVEEVKKDNPHEVYGVFRLFLCLLLQFMEDLSDRELERFIRENTAARWFCDFDLTEKTPDHTVFSRMRGRLGTSKLSEVFNLLRSQLKAQGYMSEVFTFVASHLITKASLWEERDEAIKKKYEKLNNEILPKVAKDKQAKIGCKGKTKYWYGFKEHVSVDMPSGLINKVAVTSANVTDAKGLKHVCPDQGAIFADKGYCTQPAKRTAVKKGCHLAAVRRNNMKNKNADQDRWYTKMRAPYERVFAHKSKRARYHGIEKNQFTAFMQAICFNLKRLLVINAPPLQVC
jgi:transposase, IS5 family